MGTAIGGTYHRVPSAEELDWQLRGLCRTGGYDPDLWTPEDNHEYYARRPGGPKEICRECPVMAQCAKWALDHKERYGVWGGLSEGDRQAIWKGGKPPRDYRPRRKSQTVA